MKLTNGNVFLDTNILVYAHTDIDLQKQRIAQELLSTNKCLVSTQVLQELANTLHRKFKQKWEDISEVLTEVAANSNLHINSESTIRRGCQIAERYVFSFYDSMIISSALESDCDILFTEDLNNGQIIDGRLTIENPFNKL